MPETVGLFKYLDASKLVFFENRLVLLTPPIYLNDPWDFLPKGRIPSKGEIMAAWQEIEGDIGSSSVIQPPVAFALRQQQEWLERIRVDIASKESLAAQGKDYREEIGKIVGVVSFAEFPLNRLMWAHYADSHKGFVAEFAAGETTTAHGFTIRMCAVGPVVAAKVKYHTKFQEISHDAGNVHEVVWSKHLDWEREQEWRIIWPIQKSIDCTLHQVNGTEPQRRFCLPFASHGLRRVIFGMGMKAEVRERLCDMLRLEEFRHVEKQETEIDPQTGDLVVKPFEPS